MAVIISDMKFPTRCLDCQLLGREKMYCQLYPRKDLNVIRVVSEKPDWCPLKEVPTGKWKIVADRYKCCTNCGQKLDMFHGIMHEIDFNYCPKCGVKMEQQEGDNNEIN